LKKILRNWHPFLGEMEDIFLGRCRDNDHQSQHQKEKTGPTVPLAHRPFAACSPKVGFCDLPCCLCVCESSVNFWMPEPIFTKCGMYEGYL
jgi:hypothetical protein